MDSGWFCAEVSLEPEVNMVKVHQGCQSSLWVGKATFPRELRREPLGGEPHVVSLVSLSPWQMIKTWPCP